MMNDNYEPITTTADRLQEALSMRNMKAVELSEKSGISKSQISCYLSGKYNPKAPALYRMGVALDVSELWLSGYDVPMDRPEEQKEVDRIANLADAVADRIESEKEFKELIEKINSLNSSEVAVLNSLNENQVNFIRHYLSSLDLPR